MNVYATGRRRLEKKLGRKLRPGEECHHKDHNPRNYEDRNLEVLTKEEHNIELFKGRNRLCKYRRKRENEK